jgi:xylan 1,4-beta-xylosidase
LRFKGLVGKRSAKVTIIDDQHGSPLPAWEKMGSPRFPTQAQIKELRAAAALPAAVTMPISGDALKLQLHGHALALVEIAP